MGIKVFTGYRRSMPKDSHHDENMKNPADQAQFEGVCFSDGKVAVRWLTAKRSVSVWECLADFMAIHGDPNYGTEIVWHGLAVKECT